MLRSDIGSASLIGRLTEVGKVCAWIDVSNAFDPASAAAVGVNLERFSGCDVVYGDPLHLNPPAIRSAGQVPRAPAVSRKVCTEAALVRTHEPKCEEWRTP